MSKPKSPQNAGRATASRQSASAWIRLMRNPVLVTFLTLAAVFLFLFLRGDFTEDGRFSVLSGETDFENPLAVHYIDVGQGDAALARFPDGTVMLIDAGPTAASETVCAYLESCGIETIDYLVFTHPHEDHVGGGAAVLEQYTVRTVLLPDVVHTSATYENLLTKIADENCRVVRAVSGETTAVGEASFTVLAPNETYYESLNDYSIVIRIAYLDTAFLFCGDAETISECEILDAYSPAELRSNVIKLGHHGSSTSTCSAFLDAVAPDIAVVSCGADNPYGHPHTETVEKLNERNIHMLRTDSDGTIRIYTNGHDMEIKTEKTNH